MNERLASIEYFRCWLDKDSGAEAGDVGERFAVMSRDLCGGEN